MIVPNPKLSLAEGAIEPWNRTSNDFYRQTLQSLSDHFSFNMETPFEDLDEKIKTIILYGYKEKKISFQYHSFRGSYPIEKAFEGVIPNLERRWLKSENEYYRDEVSKYLRYDTCESCGGYRLKPEALCVKIDNLHIGQISDYTIEQAYIWFAKLEKKLNDNNKQDIYKCFVVMRCWNPRAETVLNIVKEFDPDEMVLLPLYPQYSLSTSGSSIKEWNDVCSKNNYQKPVKTICCYPTETEFLNAHVSLINNKLKNLNNFRLIFSAHGLPERNIKKGDPYQWQVEQSVNKIVEQLNIPNLDWILSYQSRVGPLKWIGPSTDNEIVKSSKLNKTIVVVPIAFVSEHSETLVELDIEYKKLAEQNGCENFIRVPALGTKHEFIASINPYP